MAKSWLKKGAAAQAAMNEENEEREREFNSLWRYYLRPEEEGMVTFLEGDLITHGPQAGMFDVTYVREHRVSVPGKKVPDYYVCVAEEEECPLCATDNRSSYVGLFTVIDHNPYTNPTTGKTTKNRKKILAAKSGTLKRLIRKAKANGNSIEGSTFSVSRSDQRSATVGDEFTLVGTYSLDAIGKKLDPKDPKAAVAPADWEKELVYLSAEQLRTKFHVDAPSGPGYNAPTSESDGGFGAKPGGGDDDELPPVETDGSDLPF